MFEIMHIKLFDGQEFKVEGNEKEAELLWKYPTHQNWEILYFKKLEENGIEDCVKKLAEELKDLIIEKREKERKDDFIVKAIKGCEHKSGAW